MKMRYLVREIHEGQSAAPADGEVFSTIGAALQYVRKINKGKKVLFGSLEVTVEGLTALLKERLSTVTISIVNGVTTKFSITAFEDAVNA